MVKLELNFWLEYIVWQNLHWRVPFFYVKIKNNFTIHKEWRDTGYFLLFKKVFRIIHYAFGIVKGSSNLYLIY